MSDGISLKETTSEFSCSYTRFQSGTTELLQNNSRVMPLQLTPTNREAKVLNIERKGKQGNLRRKYGMHLERPMQRPDPKSKAGLLEEQI